MYRRVLVSLSERRNVIHNTTGNLYFYQTEKRSLNPLILTRLSQNSSNSPLKCWNCNFMYKSELFCSKCKALQEPPENLTYFEIIGVPRNFNVNIIEVHNKYRELQKMLHPDKFGNKSEKEKQLSESLSSLVNKAYSTLANPLKRGLYMLELDNIQIPEGTTNLNPEFLMDIMEKNEEIEAASRNKEKVIQLMQENKEVLDTLSKEAAEAFNNKDIQKAKVILIRMKYYDSIETRLKKLKENLGIVE